ncbi:head GIN domain-containing protein [uncultured Dokdonia sp.]|uniref:head GIN domain-containing protein n=1 Tax=uncultured Dokdonia sp. TaxID=575653 RepID=UPI00260FE103|nr:head GIN domain-containing protein [uncultured Dokdonia sp.]
MKYILNIKGWILGTLSRKRILTSSLLILTLICSCDSEDATDCLQTDGDAITRTIELPFFDKVRTENDMRLEITQGETQQIIVETRENLFNDLVFKVEDDTFIMQNKNGCNLFRDFGRTLVRITVPNLTFIKNSATYEIRSNGTLEFPNVLLESVTTPGLDSPNKTGDFFLDFQSERIVIVANGMSDFHISGTTEDLSINFSDEFPTLYGEDLIAQDVVVRHVGAAPMIVNPQASITGEIRATGDVIAKNEPPIVNVAELFTGRLLFE